MNLQETIDALEKRAARYTEAANALRVLVDQGGSLSAVPSTDIEPAPAETQEETGAEETEAAAEEETVEAAPAPAPAPRRRGRKPGPKKGRKKRSPVSAETRAKISEALRASHARRRAQAGEDESEE